MNNDIRNLSKWLNEEQETPIDRQALARVLAMAQQKPVAWMELMREARDNCKASIVEEGISAIRKEYRIDLEARLTAALNTSPPAQRKPLTDEQMFEMAEIAWRHGWASCRDADYVGEEAEDERWGMVGAEVVQDIAAHGIKEKP